MTKAEKTQAIEDLVGQLAGATHFYLTDISKLTAINTSKLRRLYFNKQIKMQVVKNSLLKKALEKSTGRDYKELMGAPLKGSTALLFTEAGSAPAKIIKEFRKTNERPLLKAAFVEQAIYVGDNQLEALAAIKSKNELIGDIIMLLQSPAGNVISALTNPDRKFKGGDEAPAADAAVTPA
jgi:large subunit ribosomal protein L10